MTLGTASVCLSVVVLHFHHRGRHGPVPKWARAFLLGTCARFLGVPGALPSRGKDRRGAHPHPMEDCACEMLEVHHRILDSKGRPLQPDDIVFHHRQDNHVNFLYDDMQHQHQQQQQPQQVEQQQQQQQNQHQQQTAASLYPERQRRRQQQQQQQYLCEQHHLEDSPPSTPRVTEEEVTAQQTLEGNIKEWQLLARVLDRIFFTIVLIITFLSAVFILLSPWYTTW